ncbi:hypothetical protein CQW23_01671 [Capsicum baccatum]|uniref:Uncharacterized protein n=1 Tax=Capsicum baccatum TaxID=33114 RepID=A0A2G2XP97_CAPBA|nr:hypothetical protein CQW23_01671 [Capsicum baccatum]
MFGGRMVEFRVQPSFCIPQKKYDLPKVKESESSGVGINAHNRDLSSLEASSFYNLSQGQVALTPTKPGHGAFAGIYHPAQPFAASTVHPLMQQCQTIGVPVDMVRPTANVYQRPQHSQMNWPNSY